MNIWIDGDGCPVVQETLHLAKRFQIPCTILCDTSHWFRTEDAQVIVCDKGADSVDYKLANLVKPGDLVITQDYGLAAMCLSRQAIPIHQDGFLYTDDNIGGLLEARAFSGKIRRSGGRLKGQKKRTAAQDRSFSDTLHRLLEDHAHASRNSGT